MAVGGALIGALRVSLGLDSAQFEAGTKRARSIAQRDATAIQKSLAGIKSGFTGLITTATIGAFAAAAKRALDYAGGLGEVSQQLGVTTKALTSYRYVASQTGVEQDAMDKSLAKLNRTMGEAAAGGKAQQAVFKDLGIDIRGLTAESALPKVADAFARLNDPTRKATLATQLFGKSGSQLIPLLNQGADGIRDLQVEAERLGITLDDKLIKQADDAADALAKVQLTLEAGFARAVAGSADEIKQLADAFALATKQAFDFFSSLVRIGRGLQTIKDTKGLFAALSTPLSEAGAIGTPSGGLRYSVDALKKARENYERKRDVFQRRPTASTKSDADKALAELRRVRSVERNARATFDEARAPIAPPMTGPTSITPARSGGGRRAPKDRTEEKLERFSKELAGLKDDELSAQQQLTTDVNERARLEQMRLDSEQKAYEFDVDSRIKQGDLTAAQGEELKLKKQAVIDAQRRAVDEQRTAELDRQIYTLTEQQLDARGEELQIDLNAARTAERRRQISIQMLDLDIERQRELVKHLQSLRDLNQASDAEVAAAEARLKSMEGQREGRVSAINRENAGPMQQYLDSLPRTADELREKFEAIKVDALNNSLDVAANQVVKLKGLAGQLFNQLINDVIRLNLQSALSGGGGGLLGSLGKLLGFTGGGSASSGLSGLGTLLGSSSGLSGAGASLGAMVPKMAGGGSFAVGGKPGIDRNVLAINGIPRAMVSHNENVSVGYGGRSGSGQSTVEVVPSPYFNVVVDGRAAGVASDVYATGAQAGARRGRWKL